MPRGIFIKIYKFDIISTIFTFYTKYELNMMINNYTSLSNSGNIFHTYFIQTMSLVNIQYNLHIKYTGITIEHSKINYLCINNIVCI